MRMLLANAETRDLVEKTFWTYVDGHRKTMSKEHRDILGEWAGPVKDLMAHNKCSSQMKYFNDHYAKGVEVKKFQQRTLKKWALSLPQQQE